jgi:hypothetical protein
MMKIHPFSLNRALALAVLLSAIISISCQQQARIGPVIPKTKVQRQMIGLLQKFDRWDENGNGELNLKELTYGLKHTSYNPTRVLRFYDTNLNQTVSLLEAQEGYKRSCQAELQIEAQLKQP